MIDNDVYPEIEHAEDKVHRTVRAALSAIPVAGGTAVEIFNALVTPPLERRKKAWIEQITCSLNVLLEQEAITWSDVEQSEIFFTRLLEASTAVLKTHQVEKIEALRNAVLNIAQSPSPLEDEEHMLLSMVDALTPTHFRVLNLLNRPDENVARIRAMPWGTTRGTSALLQRAFVDLPASEHFWDTIFRDLIQRGLVTDAEQTIHRHGGLRLPGQVTIFGEKLLALVADPFKKDRTTE